MAKSKKAEAPKTDAIVPEVVPFPDEYPSHAAVTRIVTELPDVVDDFERRSDALIVRNQEGYEAALTLATDIGDKLKVEDGKRSEQSKPFYDVYSGINAAFKPWLDRLRAAQRTVKSKAEKWFLAEQEKRRRREQEQREREAARAEAGRVVRPRHMPEPLAQTMHTESGARGTMKERWVYEVVDVSKVPRKYLMVNDKLVLDTINAEARSLGEPSPIKGLRFSRTANLTAGRSKR